MPSIPSAADCRRVTQCPESTHKCPASHLLLTVVESLNTPGAAALRCAGEYRAFTRCVEYFLLDKQSREDKTVKVNVAWDENDYQIDVGTEAGMTEYKRIIDRNHQFGKRRQRHRRTSPVTQSSTQSCTQSCKVLDSKPAQPVLSREFSEVRTEMEGKARACSVHQC